MKKLLIGIILLGAFTASAKCDLNTMTTVERSSVILDTYRFKDKIVKEGLSTTEFWEEIKSQPLLGNEYENLEGADMEAAQRTEFFGMLNYLKPKQSDSRTALVNFIKSNHGTVTYCDVAIKTGELYKSVR
ncbi:MAG: hypothetical protein CME64_18050 [Halobacteriovoraceae bacterium]|nr:hypothetical protein [Halobacteriovoraceae bacterium]|tara:strand:- start:69 stop:461 length:393 start_codon:yes stop_codon:yes gene_type:complete